MQDVYLMGMALDIPKYGLLFIAIGIDNDNRRVEFFFFQTMEQDIVVDGDMDIFFITAV
ncbi:hypothetical protein SPONN_1425 [uncultured Candidatus Thioglobus sp.]|nr:hypothetical protein SPONN_1425 [uncultured Candidatus Thioglobus sp.]